MSKFPATSIGRSAGARLTDDPLGTNYVPYTPRRTTTTTSTSTPSSSTASTHTHSTLPSAQVSAISSSSAGRASALDKLKLVSLGVGAGTVGWAIVERLSLSLSRDEDKDDEDGWQEVWDVLSTGTGMLLLPLELSTKDVHVNLELIRDHIVFSHFYEKEIVTLGGLRGWLDWEARNLVVRSSYSQAYSPSLVSTIAPLPPPLEESEATAFPTYHIPSAALSISISPPSAPPTLPPPLPRRAYPFSSIFGGSGGKTPASATGRASPTPSINDKDKGIEKEKDRDESGGTKEIKVMTIDGRVGVERVAKAVNDAVKGILRAANDRDKELEALLPFSLTPPYRVQESPYAEEVLDGVVRDWYTAHEHDGDEKKTDEGIEKRLCHAFYDRLFKVQGEVTERIEALRTAEMGLEEVDLDYAGDIARKDDGSSHDAKLMSVLARCGACLERMNEEWTASGKIRLMVECHRALVEGLKGDGVGKVGVRKDEPPADKDDESADKDDEPPQIDGEKKSRNGEISLDVLFPLLILSVVRANPRRLVSHVVFAQRYMPPDEMLTLGQDITPGEARYCLVNLLAVIEFLSTLALDHGSSSDSGSGLALDIHVSPPRSRAGSVSSLASAAALRDQVDALAGSANKVLSGSFGMLKSLLPAGAPSLHLPTANAPSLPGMGMRRDSVFSLFRDEGPKEEEMRPVSRATTRGAVSDYESDREDDFSESASNDEDEQDEDEDDSVNGERGRSADRRSIRSFESQFKDKGKSKGRGRGRKSLTDRLAAAGKALVVKGEAIGPAKRSQPIHVPAIITSRAASPAMMTARPPLASGPVRKFLTCAPDGADLRVGDVGDLVKEYRRVVSLLWPDGNEG